MRDFPVFTTQFGAAGLVLREIPYKGIAYITIHDSLQPKELLEECCSFCRSAGATEIYVADHPFVEQNPMHTEIWQMTRSRTGLPKTDAVLQNVTEETLEFWRNLHNERMRSIPNGATVTRADGEKMVKQGSAYYVYRGDVCIGIGVAAGDKVESVIAVQPGAGADVLLALCGALTSEQVHVEVASANLPALRLYDKLGFQKSATLSRWFKIE